MSARTKTLRDQAQELRDQLAPHVESARDQLGPKLTEARDQLAPVLADARDKAAPHVAEARGRLVNDVIPAVQSALADAREQAGPATEEARRRGVAAAAALKGEPVRKRGRKRKALALLTLVGAGVIAARKLFGGGAGSHASYSPPTPTRPAGVSADAAGASPDEAFADLAEQPHAVTTPDDPAEVTDVSDQPEV